MSNRWQFVLKVLGAGALYALGITTWWVNADGYGANLAVPLTTDEYRLTMMIALIEIGAGSLLIAAVLGNKLEAWASL